MTVEPVSPGRAPGPRDVPLGQIAAWLARQSEIALLDVELSLPQYRVLALLSEGLALPSSLAEKLDVRRPSVTSVVDGLVPRGLVVRAHDASDRRTVTHELTPAGARLLRRADSAIASRLRTVTETVSSEAEAGEFLEALGSWGPVLRAWRTLRNRQPVGS